MHSPADAPLVRAGCVLGGGALLVIGIVTLPVPLFPSIACVLFGLALIARASQRIRRWLLARSWVTRALALIPNHAHRERVRVLLFGAL
jgi:uncharacterized membrane protein YbaN (DUF454 family)